MDMDILNDLLRQPVGSKETALAYNRSANYSDSAFMEVDVKRAYKVL